MNQQQAKQWWKGRPVKALADNLAFVPAGTPGHVIEAGHISIVVCWHGKRQFTCRMLPTELTVKDAEYGKDWHPTEAGNEA